MASVGVTTLDRPAAAPQTGEYDLGYHVIANPTFVAAITSVSTIFVSSAGSSAFMPVMSEMKRPRDYNKAVYLCSMSQQHHLVPSTRLPDPCLAHPSDNHNTVSVVTASYLAFSLVVYRWCGKWVASPSLGSAGPTIKKVSYGVAMVGLLVSACLYLHVAAKYLFVRILRRSVHLQRNTATHWAVWLGCTFGVAAVGFLLGSGVPIFSFLIALSGGNKSS